MGEAFGQLLTSKLSNLNFYNAFQPEADEPQAQINFFVACTFVKRGKFKK